MLIRDIFARNLRTLSEARGSINHVCRQLGIHRQQFAVYLRGDRLPNKTTLARLSRYFNVPEDAFFIDPSIAAGAGAAADDPCKPLVERIKSLPPALSAGLYQTFFWAPVLGDDVVTALTVVKQQDGALGFRRLTATGERGDPTWSYVKGDHQGVVSERLGWIYFQASNRMDPHEPSLMAVKWAALSEPLLVGHAMVISHLGPMIANVVLSPYPQSMSLLGAIRRTRVFNRDDPKIALYRRFLNQPIVY